MIHLTQLSSQERSLLLFLECCAVDYGGMVDTKRMSSDDIETAKRWSSEGFIEFGRICASDLSRHGSHWVRLSERAWVLAHEERRARFERIHGKRTWRTVEEYRNESKQEGDDE